MKSLFKRILKKLQGLQLEYSYKYRIHINTHGPENEKDWYAINVIIFCNNKILLMEDFIFSSNHKIEFPKILKKIREICQK